MKIIITACAVICASYCLYAGVDLYRDHQHEATVAEIGKLQRRATVLEKVVSSGLITGDDATKYIDEANQKKQEASNLQRKL